jgi:hypothetical protein
MSGGEFSLLPSVRLAAEPLLAREENPIIWSLSLSSERFAKPTEDPLADVFLHQLALRR